MASGKSAGINGVAVAIAATGGVLAYAGFRGVTPIEALRDITSGKKPEAIEDRSAELAQGLTPGVFLGLAAGLVPGVGNAAVVQAAMKYKGDQYSQGLRHRSGYSDCSSFVSKAYKDVGIKPPTPDTTIGYLSSPRWVNISAGEAQAGDIVVSRAHMVLVTGPGQAIGQQNPRDDVKTGSIKSLMANSGKYVYRRYKGSGSSSKGGKSGPPTMAA